MSVESNLERNDFCRDRRAFAFRQSDISRAIKGAQAAGISVKRIEIDPAGKIVIMSGGPEENAGQDLYLTWSERKYARAA